MPSALETLVKILKLEREQGLKNSAVIGGLAAFGNNWSKQAHSQSRRPEQHVLVDEITDILKNYEQIESKNDRLTVINYAMDRIMGRADMPDDYRYRLEMYQDESGDDTDLTTQSIEESSTEPAPAESESTSSNNERKTVTRKEKRTKNKDKDRNKSKQSYRERQPVNVPHASQDEDEEEESANEGEQSADEFAVTYTGVMDIPQEQRLSRPPRTRRKQVSAEEASDIMRGLSASVTNVKGVGGKMEQTLQNLGIETINDMVFFLPRRYDDYTRLLQISKLQPNITATVIGTVRKAEVLIGRNNRRDFAIELDDGSGILPIRFFSQYYLAKQIRAGNQIVVRGKTSLFLGKVQLTNPEWERLDAENLQMVGIVPVYPLTEGLNANTFRRLMKNTIEYWADRIPDYVPESILERAELADLGWAIRNLHFPEGHDHLYHARNRYIFDQLLMLQLAVLNNRREWQSVPSYPIETGDEFLEGFIDTVFPFPLTSAQRRAIEDIRRDMTRDVPMNRLLQGDVGAGKTAVAATALAMAFANGKQSALMAPTSILAEQHYRGISKIFDKLEGDRKPVVGLLTSALTTTERESIYRGLADGSIDVIIGTHALIQEGVEFNNLALAIIDEQHRFGVEQRGALRGKGSNPHLLVMTATPIPRTLALTMHADLDLTVIDEMPPGRIPIKTRIVRQIEREAIHRFIERQLDEGRQAFVVHPLVEASETSDSKSAVEAFEELSKVFYNYRVGLLHGRMSPTEKDEIMRAFSNHEFDILSTTSVAEVGVDIPNASVIVIEGANRFGLAQLHQFRGRVGRGQFESYCLLIPDKDSPESMQRLEALESTTDGFKLAELDWQMRGAGDLVGTRQSGKGALQIMEALTSQLVDLAQREARTLFEEDPELEKPEHALLKQRVDMLYNPDSDVS